MKIWIDADGCPRDCKEVVFRAGTKRSVVVWLVANRQIHVPRSSMIFLQVVSEGPDVADQYIVDHAEVGDLAITADIPLASQLVDKQIVTINPRGKVYTPENVKEALATRNLMEELRSGGAIGGGPPAFGPKDKEKFANSFDRELTKLQKKSVL